VVLISPRRRVDPLCDAQPARTRTSVATEAARNRRDCEIAGLCDKRASGAEMKILSSTSAQRLMAQRLAL